MPGARRWFVAFALLGSVVSGAVAAPVAADPRGRPEWASDLDTIIGERPFSVSVAVDGETWYRHKDWVARPPASNQKVFLSMVMLDRYAPGRTIRTEVRTDAPIVNGVVRGDVWLVGHGDPETKTARLGALADAMRDAGIQRIRGAVIGSTGAFRRDWWAPGWRDYFPDVYIALPTALTFDENEGAGGVHIADPERRAAQALTGRLRSIGVGVRDPAEWGTLPAGTHNLASVRSADFEHLLRHMNVPSSNFRAEVLGKYLALDTGKPGTIAAGARTMCAWIARRGPAFTCHDSSGLSYDNRATTEGIVDLLWFAEDQPWGDVLRSTLARAGTGTLDDPDRLMGLKVRVKTGTLEDASALSGWVRSKVDGRWIAFSILSNHFDDATAKGIEDQIVRLIANEATDPTP